MFLPYSKVNKERYLEKIEGETTMEKNIDTNTKRSLGINKILLISAAIIIVFAVLVMLQVIQIVKGSAFLPMREKFYNTELIMAKPGELVNIGDISMSVVDANDSNNIVIGILKPVDMKVIKP